MYYRLVAPIWSREFLPNKKPNTKFRCSISGPPVIEGENFSSEFLKKKNVEGYGVYFFPNYPNKNPYTKDLKFLRGRCIDVFRNVFVDMDLKEGIYKTKDEFLTKLKGFPIKPTTVVSSGHGVHAYWRVSDLDRDIYLEIQMRLISEFKTDKSVWTVLQLMRLPNYTNTKSYEAPIPCEILKEVSSKQIYTASDLMKHLPMLEQKQSDKIQIHRNRLDGIFDIEFSREDINTDELPDRFMADLNNDPPMRTLFEDPKQKGDRSVSDMKLCHILFSKGYNVKEAIAVIKNTQKALEAVSRMAYVYITVEKVYASRPKRIFKSIQTIVNEVDDVLEPQIYGPSFLDYKVLHHPWRRKELLGIISGAGVGKTAVTLNIFREIILNNNNDDIFVFFSLEMTKKEIAARWLNAVGKDSPLSNRLFVIDYLDDKNQPRQMGLQEMYADCKALVQQTGCRIGAIAFDHFHVVSTHIDEGIKPNFGIQSIVQAHRGEIKNLTLNALAKQIKALITMLDCYGMVLSQTTKSKSGVGDLPLEKDACYGCSEYEWTMNRILTIWQPLIRLNLPQPYNVLAYKYVKIRDQHTTDKLKVGEPKVIKFFKDTGLWGFLSPEEYQDFREALPTADEARKAAQEQRGTTYSVAQK